VEPAGDLPVTPAAALTAPLARDADFQAAWYYSIVVFTMIVVVAWGMWLCIRHLRGMWRNGDRGLALAVGGAVAVAFLMFASMLVTVAVAMLPVAYHGAAG